MPPINFEEIAKSAFDEVKCALGIEAIYFPKVGGPVTLRGVFDDRVQEVTPDSEVAISSNVYSLGLKLDDLPAPPVKGDKVIIKNITYKVINSMEDGVDGVSTVLFLHRCKGVK